MSVTVTVNHAAIRARVEAAANHMVAMLAETILADCNEYCRVDQGTLRASSYTASDLDNGMLIWNTPYAKKVYYTGTPSTEPNPNASLMWCEKAHNAHGSEWDKRAQRFFEEGMK